MDNNSIGQRIRYERVQAGWSQEKLAEFADVSRVHISAIERGEKAPSLEPVVMIANALKISVDKILGENLTVRTGEGRDPLLPILLDCTPEENSIIVRNASELKEILRGFKIKK